MKRRRLVAPADIVGGRSMGAGHHGALLSDQHLREWTEGKVEHTHGTEGQVAARQRLLNEHGNVPQIVRHLAVYVTC
jgi:hypothetical protein